MKRLMMAWVAATGIGYAAELDLAGEWQAK